MQREKAIGQRPNEKLWDAHRGTHSHSVGTDLEAPVVWLLLRGKEAGKEKRKMGEERRGGRISECETSPHV